MLDSTLVIALGEFGRTPKISTLSGQAKAGRDHWANAMSVLFAGGGAPGGTVIGATDRKGFAANERVLSTFLGYHHEQGLSRRRYEPVELFAAEATEAFVI